MEPLLVLMRAMAPGLDDVKLAALAFTAHGWLQSHRLPEKAGGRGQTEQQHHIKSDAQRSIKFEAPVTPNSGVSLSVSDLDLISSDPESGSGSDPDLSKQIRENAIRDEPAAPAGFLEFWGLYPRRVGKADARRAWIRKRPPITKVRDTLAWQRRCPQWLAGYIPHPTTWINREQWNDEPEAPATNGHRKGWAAPTGDYGKPGEQKL